MTGPRAWCGFGGSFQRGSETAVDDNPSAPRHQGILVDRTEVTNRQYHDFVRATGYVTVAERQSDPGVRC